MEIINNLDISVIDTQKEKTTLEVEKIREVLKKLYIIKDYFSNKKFNLSFINYYELTPYLIQQLEICIIEKGGFFEIEEAREQQYIKWSKKIIDQFEKDNISGRLK